MDAGKKKVVYSSSAIAHGSPKLPPWQLVYNKKDKEEKKEEEEEDIQFINRQLQCKNSSFVFVSITFLSLSPPHTPYMRFLDEAHL